MTPIKKLRQIVANLEDADVDGFVLATARMDGGSIECLVKGMADDVEMSHKLDQAVQISSWHDPEPGDAPGDRRW